MFTKKQMFKKIISAIMLQCVIVTMPFLGCIDQLFCLPNTYDNSTLSPRLNLTTLDLKNSMLKGVDLHAVSDLSFLTEPINDLSDTRNLIQEYLPQQYWNKFTVQNLPLHIYGEGPILEHHLQAMLNVLDNASKLNLPEKYKNLLTSEKNREFFEAFILFHDIAKISIKQKDIIEEGNKLSLYPNHESEAVALLEKNPEWLSRFSKDTQSVLIEVIALHRALYLISANPASADDFMDFMKEHNISLDDVDKVMPYLIAADILDVFGTYRPDSWQSRPLNFAKEYEDSREQRELLRAKEYQEELNENFKTKDSETKEKLALSQDEINETLEKNRIAFVPEQKEIHEKSIFISVDVGHSKELRDYAKAVQKKMVTILGHKSKIRLNPLGKLHFTLVNNEIGENVDISDEGIKNSHILYEEAIKTMDSFPVEVHGPHMMSNLGVVLEVRANSLEVLLFRNKAQKILEKEKREKGVDGFVPDIIHISLGYIVEASKEQLEKIYSNLEELRNVNVPLVVNARKAQTGKTVNKAMSEQGEVVHYLSIEYMPIIMQSI